MLMKCDNKHTDEYQISTTYFYYLYYVLYVLNHGHELIQLAKGYIDQYKNIFEIFSYLKIIFIHASRNLEFVQKRINYVVDFPFDEQMNKRNSLTFSFSMVNRGNSSRCRSSNQTAQLLKHLQMLYDFFFVIIDLKYCIEISISKVNNYCTKEKNNQAPTDMNIQCIGL